MEIVSTMKYYGITCRGYEKRKALTDSHLIHNGINVEWMRGLNGEHSGVTTINPLIHQNPESTEVMSSGHVSLCINHWFAWNKALADDCDVAIFFEDDCRVVDSFLSKLESSIYYLDNIDKNWDLLYAGHWEGSSHPDYKGHCYDVVTGPVATLKSPPFGTHCYAVKSRSIQGMLNSCERIHAMIDVALWLDASPLQRQYACVPSLAWQEVDHEDYKISLSYSKYKAYFDKQ
jgi:GR25 family glycosyltransferase involved in LPS biosynthesis